MTEAEEYQRRIQLAKSGGTCEVCGKPIAANWQGAHRIANTKGNRIKWGSFIIDSPLNLAIVCSLGCNSKCNIGNNEGKCLQLAAKIVAQAAAKYRVQEGAFYG